MGDWSVWMIGHPTRMTASGIQSLTTGKRLFSPYAFSLETVRQ
jgi:hypothetical protein